MKSTLLAIILIVYTTTYGQNLDLVFEKINNKDYNSAVELLEEKLKKALQT